MIEHVVIEATASLEKVQNALLKQGIAVRRLDNECYLATVSDSRDAEQEVSDTLIDALIIAYVTVVRTATKDPTRHCFREENCEKHPNHTGPNCCCCGFSAKAHEGCDCEEH